MKILKFTLGVLSLLLVAATQSVAQVDGTATIAATADIAATVVVDGTAGLDFGTDLAPGTPVTIDPQTDATAGHFTITGTPGAEVDAVLTLPTDLIHDVDGTTTLPVDFTGNTAAWALAGADQATATLYDPSTTLTEFLDITTGELHIWLGGTLNPGDPQKAGTYSADITLDITYTGN